MEKTTQFKLPGQHDKKGIKKMIRKGIDVEFKCPACGNTVTKKIKVSNPWLWFLGFPLIIPIFIMVGVTMKEARAMAVVDVAYGKSSAEGQIGAAHAGVQQTAANVRARANANYARGGSGSVGASGALAMGMAQGHAKKMEKLLTCQACKDARYNVRILGWHDKNRTK